MIHILTIEKAEIWDNIVKSFANHDIYYFSGYVKAFQIHGDGDPHLLYYVSDKLRAIYVFMKRATDIDGYFDSITPYGYGGMLFEGDITNDNLNTFWSEYTTIMQKNKIVDNFVRYHPVLANAIPMKKVSTVIDLGKTIAIDLCSPDIIWSNISSKNRNMIRKAEKNNIKILNSKDFSLFADFRHIYNSTMDKDNASMYYYFNEAFYQSIHKDLFNNYEMFYAVLNGKPIAMSIILYANKQMHYHLSGSITEFRHLAPSNLLLYKAAIWGFEQGFKTFHLGGGVGSDEDNLYKFKAAFNRNSNYQFSIGKELFNKEIYKELVNLRIAKDSHFDKESTFFPLYRS